jgi:hypothetical protein
MERSVMSLIHRFVMFFRCRVFDRHRVVVSVNGPYKGIGDGYDLFGECVHCGKVCSRDTHWTGDGNWYRVDKT